MNEILKFDQGKKQAFADGVLQLINPAQASAGECVRRDYAGGFSLDLPAWFCHHDRGSNGHDLQNSYTGKIELLKKHKDLKETCITVILKNYPELIPKVFVDLMERLRG